jgi:uncharacterized protein with PIN domain
MDQSEKVSKVTFRFYEELNDFLPKAKRKVAFSYHFICNPSVKDTVEAIGVPHTEIDLILVNGESVGFNYHLRDGDRVAVYPVFESLDISNAMHLRKEPLRRPKYILDVHLGKLAKKLRMLGFDTLYENHYSDAEIVRRANAEKRVILTRDIGILKIKEVERGYWIRSQSPNKQLSEVLNRFDLYARIKPFQRCMLCNGIIEQVEKSEILGEIPAKTKRYYNEFYRCKSCKNIYWKGSHYQKMINYVKSLGLAGQPQ